MTMARERRRPRSRQQRQGSPSLPRVLAAAAVACLPTAVKCRAESALFSDTEMPPQPRQSIVAYQVTSMGAVSNNCEDLSYITGPMHEADADGNGFLSQDEYVEFTDAISGGYLTEMGWSKWGFAGMPLSLQETYLVLSCICELYPNQPWGGPGCCTSNPETNTGIRTDGTAPGEEPDEIQEQYLTYVCGTMSDSLEKVGAEIVAPPTASPTGKPTTALPTRQPTKLVRITFRLQMISSVSAFSRGLVH